MTGRPAFCLMCKRMVGADDKVLSVEVIRDADNTIEGYLHRQRCLDEWKAEHPNGFTYR